MEEIRQDTNVRLENAADRLRRVRQFDKRMMKIKRK